MSRASVAPSVESSRAAAMPRPRRKSIWSFIKAISGETTTVTPSNISAGSW